MSFDGNILRVVTNELKDALTTGRINKIYQLSAYDLLFIIHHKKQKQQLLVSASPNYARIHLTTKQTERPNTPPTFCMFLRKHLEGGIIQKIEQIGNDRLIIFDIEKRNELGDLQIKKLVIEVTGRHANIIVTDSEFKILEAMKHNMPFDGTDRTIFPGAIYRVLPNEKVDPLNKELRDSFLDNPNNINRQSLLNHFQGCSPLLVNEVLNRYESNLDIKSIFEDLLTTIKPVIISARKDYFYYTDLTHIDGQKKYFDTVNEMLDRYYFERDSLDIIRQRSKDIIKFVRNQIDKAKHKIEKLTKELKNTDKRDIFKIKGELIQANMYNMKKGETLLKTINYYDNSEIEIVLDPKKDPIENMEKYFKKYKKLRKSVPHINTQLESAKQEIQYFEELLHQIENATLKDIEEIKEELEDKKYLKKKQTNKKQKKKKKPNFDTYVDEDGIEIVVGKNNIQNEFITHKLAKHNEIWFHVKDSSGSHVVVRSSDELSETTIRTASHLAAYHSKMRQSSSVPVDYVEVRYIKKVPGRIGSFVTYKNNKTIYIDPDQEFVIALKKK